MLGVAVGVFVYSFLCLKFGHIEVEAKKEYTESSAN